MRVTQIVREVDVIPGGYGFVHRQHSGFGMVVAPIPLNFVLGAWHWFYWRFLVLGFRPDAIDDIARVHYDRGYREGESRGYEQGFRHAKIALDARGKP